jgi:hypothetical protein
MPRARTPRTRGYRLAVYPAVLRTTNTRVTRLVLETAQAFATFQYSLSVQEDRNSNTLHYRILGLHAPANLLPSSGPALFVRDYPDLSGMVEVQIDGVEKRTLSCAFDVSPGRVRLVKPPAGSMLSVSTEPTMSQNPGRQRP